MKLTHNNFDRITFDPNVMAGKACIRGMRITVNLILNLLSNRMTVDDIVATYPYLEQDDVWQALRYGAWLADESIYELPLAAI
jgi:uncharacterized protein (DUF433 family)